MIAAVLGWLGGGIKAICDMRCGCVMLGGGQVGVPPFALNARGWEIRLLPTLGDTTGGGGVM